MVATHNGTSSFHEVARVEDGTKQAPLQVSSKSRARGNVISPQVFIPVKEFYSTYHLFESHTLVGYFIGRIPNDTLLRTWVSQVWSPYGFKVENVQNLTKGFFLFRLFDPLHVQKFLNKGIWIVCNSLLELQPYTPGFNVADEGVMDVLVWVEFPILSIPLRRFLKSLGESIGQFVCFEPEKFFSITPRREFVLRWT